MYKAKKNEHGTAYYLKSRLVAPSRLLETNWFWAPSLALPCILDTNFSVVHRYCLFFEQLQETIIIIQPQDFDHGSGQAYLLQKCMYGLKQSWVQLLFWISIFLKSTRFKICPKEPCLLLKDEVLFCWWLPGYVKNKAGLWKISEIWIQDQTACKSPNTYWLSKVSLEWIALSQH